MTERTTARSSQENGRVEDGRTKERNAIERLREIADLNSDERRASQIVELVGPIVDELIEIEARQNLYAMDDKTPYSAGGYILDEDGDAELDFPVDPAKPDGPKEKKKLKSCGQRKHEIADGIEAMKNSVPPKIWKKVEEGIEARGKIEPPKPQAQPHGSGPSA